MPETSTTSENQNSSGSGLMAVFGVAAVLALVMAFTAVVMAAGDSGGGSTDSGAAGPVHVSLSEFAITPDVISVPEGGSLHVTNDGATAHNLTIADTDLATADLPAGGSEELDVSSLAVGSYQVSCLIPGHADSGMTGSLEITAGAGGDAAAASDTTMAGMDMSGGDTMDYQAMTDAMNETIGQFPAETEGLGNPELEPTILPDGTKHFELTAEITAVGGGPRPGRGRLDLQRHRPRPPDARRHRRQRRDPGHEQPAHGHGPAPARRERAQLHGRGGPDHPGPDPAR